MSQMTVCLIAFSKKSYALPLMAEVFLLKGDEERECQALFTGLTGFLYSF